MIVSRVECGAQVAAAIVPPAWQPAPQGELRSTDDDLDFDFSARAATAPAKAWQPVFPPMSPAPLATSPQPVPRSAPAQQAPKIQPQIAGGRDSDPLQAQSTGLQAQGFAQQGGVPASAPSSPNTGAGRGNTLTSPDPSDMSNWPGVLAAPQLAQQGKLLGQAQTYPGSAPSSPRTPIGAEQPQPLHRAKSASARFMQFFKKCAIPPLVESGPS